ncbi:hypothetical protein KUV89_17345 [Marinobacter hydrocarbonoclasticus]|nr:hypothetical protein [Marinobacter nauticus]
MMPALAKLHLSGQEGLLQAHAQLRLPPIASQLAQRTGEQVLEKLGLFYRQCGEAQRWAAVGLIEQQRGIEPKAVTQAARDQALALEWVTEHSWQLWRIAHEVLPACPERLALLTRWRQALTEQRDALCALRHLPGAAISPAAAEPLKPWLSEWQQWVWQPLLETIERQGWDRLFVTPAEIQKRLESGPASRCGLVAPGLPQRLEALWQELWLATDALHHPGSLTAAEGIAGPVTPGSVPAARGHLTHRCVWDGDRVADYAIQIPTERTLTAIAESLQGQPLPQQDNWQAGLGVWILSHAPCLEVAVVDSTEVQHA